MKHTMTIECRKNGLLMREYVARSKRQIVDRFSVFQGADGTWTAWTGDTISATRKTARVQFAATLGANRTAPEHLEDTLEYNPAEVLEAWNGSGTPLSGP